MIWVTEHVTISYCDILEIFSGYCIYKIIKQWAIQIEIWILIIESELVSTNLNTRCAGAMSIEHGNQIKISNQYKNQYTVAALQQVNEVNQDGIFQRKASTVEISSQDRLLGLTVEDNTILLHLEPLHDALLGKKLWETNLADLHRKTGLMEKNYVHLLMKWQQSSANERDQMQHL